MDTSKLVSVLGFIVAFIVPMTALFVWVFIRPVLKEKDPNEDTVAVQTDSGGRGSSQ